MFGTQYTENIDELIAHWNELATLNTISKIESDLIDDLIDALFLYSKLLKQIFIETMNHFIATYNTTDTNDIKLAKQTQLSQSTIEAAKVTHLVTIVYDQIRFIDDELINNPSNYMIS